MSADNTKRSPRHAKTKAEVVNVWLNTHNQLPDEKKIEARDAVMTGCGWSQNTFYLRMKAPHKVRDIEKPVIAKAYHKRVTYMFPELEQQTA